MEVVGLVAFGVPAAPAESAVLAVPAAPAASGPA